MSHDARLEMLESQVRRLRRALLALSGLLVAGLLLAASRPAQDAAADAVPDALPDVVRARGFEVVDKEGTTVVTLRATDFGGSLDIRNTKGTAVGVLSAYEGWGVLGIYDDQGRVAARLRADRSGALRVFNEAQQVVVDAGVSDTGDGWLRTRDAAGYDTSPVR